MPETALVPSSRRLQRQKIDPLSSREAPPIVHEVLRSPGRPLDAGIQTFFESRFGHDFSRVRVHHDAKAAQSAQAVQAQAYTVGQDIAFDFGRYEPGKPTGLKLLAHELTHTVQQRTAGGRPSDEKIFLDPSDSPQEHEAAATSGNLSPPSLGMVNRCLQRKRWDDLPIYEERPEIVKQSPAGSGTRGGSPAPKAKGDGKCEEFPGGSTDCEVDETTGTPTGKVSHRVDEKNPCTRPCVERHEQVHVRQLKKFCPELRACYLEADQGKRPATDCVKMVLFGSKQRECEAYNVSVPCVEDRVKNASECQSKENQAYGARKLASEKCFRDKNCTG